MSNEERLPTTPSQSIAVTGVRVVELTVYRDERGALSFAQHPDQLPFVPVRYFLLHDLTLGESRGNHAHKQLEQFLVCVSGSCRVDLDNGRDHASALLDQPGRGLFVPRMVWTTVRPLAAGTAVLVLTSERYDAEDYIRDYQVFQQAASFSQALP